MKTLFTLTNWLSFVGSAPSMHENLVLCWLLFASANVIWWADTLMDNHFGGVE